MSAVSIEEMSDAAKVLLDNPAYKVVIEGLRQQAADAVLNGTVEEAETNLRNYQAIAMLLQITENLGRG